jgi:hypothetical protein
MYVYTDMLTLKIDASVTEVNSFKNKLFKVLNAEVNVCNNLIYINVEN